MLYLGMQKNAVWINPQPPLEMLFSVVILAGSDFVAEILSPGTFSPTVVELSSGMIAKCDDPKAIYVLLHPSLGAT